MDSNRRGFNGMEKDDEVKGGGNSYDFGARMYDARVGRFMSRDPLENTFSYLSPFAFSNNRVIDASDFEGKDPRPKGKQGKSGFEGQIRTSYAGNILIGYMGYTQVYHSGGRFTKAGWYLKKDYDFISKPIEQDRDVSTANFYQSNPLSAIKIGKPDWDDDGDISSYAVVAGTNAKIAGNDKETIQAQNNDGTIYNAFRHTLWQSLICYELGSSIAAHIGYAHEESPNADLLIQNENLNEIIFNSLFEADEVVDLLNNRIGRQIGQKCKDDGLNLTRKEMVFKTLDYFKENGLYVATVNSDKTVSIKKYKLTDKEYNRAAQNIKEQDINGFNNKDEKYKKDK